jgi:hypothetical protein
MPSHEYLLVMTACIGPSAAADPAIRILDYQKALCFWLSLPDPRTRRILFIANSGYPLDTWKLSPTPRIHCTR